MNQFHVLALDGGGIRGIFSAAMLAQLEADCQVAIDDHFDLIAGTSTGGLIALALGAGFRPTQIVDFYQSYGPNIFRDRLALRKLTHWAIRKYPRTPLEIALRQQFGDRTLGSSRKRLVIPSYNVGEDDVYIFRTPHHAKLRRDYKVPMWKIASATTAAPTYFGAYTGIDGLRLVDGGIWANNPITVAIAEAVSTLSVPLSSIRVLSLGTCDVVSHAAKHLDHAGKLPWARKATDVILRAQTISASKNAAHLLGKDDRGLDRVTRLDPKVPNGLFSLDKLTIRELMAKAAHESRIAAPMFQELFARHRAGAFDPIYQ